MKSSNNYSKHLINKEHPPENEKEIIRVLLEKQNAFIEAGDYLKAHDIKQEINSIKQAKSNIKKREKSELREKSLENIYAAYLKEINEVYSEFDEIINGFSEEVKEEENKQAIKHLKAREEYAEVLEKTIPSTVKFSSTYLDFRHKEGRCVKNKDFLNANYFKTEAERLGKSETEEFMKKRCDKIDQLMSAMIEKQVKEKEVLREKKQRELINLQKEREKELNHIQMKYKNKKNMVDIANGDVSDNGIFELENSDNNIMMNEGKANTVRTEVSFLGMEKRKG